MLLKLIKPEEWTEFKKFVASPVFNKGRNYESLVNILSKFHPEFDSDELTKQNIYKKIYPGKIFKESVMNTTLSGLNQMCEEFFLYQDFMNNPQRDMRLLRQYSKRGYKKRADKIAAKLEKQISKPAVSGLEYYERLEIFDSLDNYYTSYDNRKMRNYLLINSLLNLDYFFLLQTFTYQKELYSSAFFAESKFDETLAFQILKEINSDKLIEIIEKEDPENSILLSIYYLIVQNMGKDFDERNYNKLKKLVIINLKDFDFQSGKFLLLNLQVIITKRLNEGKKSFEKELYEISKLLIDGRYYDNDVNWFRASHFRTIVKIGISLNDLEYIEKFIENYYVRLEPNLRLPLKYFAAANVCFAKKLYDEALSNIMKADINNTLFKIDSKRMTAKIYYETGSFESLQSLLDAFAHFLKNIKTTDQIIIKRNKNFIKYLKMILKLKGSKSTSFEADHLIEILKKENVSEVNWLVEKLGVL